jgi:pimeloyl-ACP methyl ester carboxylesterase
MMSGLRNIPSLFSGSYAADITSDVIRGGAEIALSSARETPPDILVASSMGGAIALECLRTGKLSVPTILLAPALGRLLDQQSISMKEWCDGFVAREGHGDHPVIVVHGVKDDVIDIEHSRELCHRVGAELVEVADGDHSLNNYLLDGVSKEDGSPQGNNLSRIIDGILKGVS